MDEKIEAVKRLQEIIETLRGPDGCPWDREQTLRSLCGSLLEETCEVIDAVENTTVSAGPSDPDICEELGDLLMNILLATRIAEEAGGFDLAGVARGITAKLVRRHPHVFGDDRVESSAEVLVLWKEIKAAEKAAATTRSGNRPTSILDAVPRSLPPLAAAHELGKKAAERSFDWPDASGALDKVREEMRELESAFHNGSHDQQEHEIGDLLLAVANFSRKVGLAPDTALRHANQRFRSRFRSVESIIEKARAAGRACPTLAEMEETWQEAKRREARQSGP